MPTRLNFGCAISESPPPPACIACNTCTSYNTSLVTQLTIRSIDDQLKRALRLRAAENGRSMEEEVRQILRAALGVPSPEQEALEKMEELAAREIEDRKRRG